MLKQALLTDVGNLGRSQLDALVRLQLFAWISKTGFEHSLVLEKAHGHPESPSRKYKYIKEGEGINDLYHLLCVRMFGSLEAYTGDVCRSIIRNDGTIWSQDSLKKLRLPASAAFSDDSEKLVEVVYRDLADHIKAPLKQGIGRFEELFGALGYGGPVFDHAKSAIFRLANYRNCIVHSGGIVDVKLVEALPDLEDKLGKQLAVTVVELRQFLLSAFWYMNEVHRRVASKFDVTLIGLEDEQARSEAMIKSEVVSGPGLPFSELNTAVADDYPYGIRIVVLGPAMDSQDGGHIRRVSGSFTTNPE